MPFFNHSLQKTNRNITLNPRSKVDFNIQIQFNLDFQTGISVFFFLAFFACWRVRGAALAQCVSWVVVEWVATTGQWLFCDIGCVLRTVVCSNQYLPKVRGDEKIRTYTLSAIFLFLKC